MSKPDEFSLRALRKEAKKDVESFSVDAIPKSADLAMEKQTTAQWLTFFTFSLFLTGYKGSPILEQLKWVTPNALWGRSYFALSAYTLSAMIGLSTINAWADAHKQANNTRTLIESNKRTVEMYREANYALRKCERTLSVLAKCDSQGVAFDKDSLDYLKADCHGKYQSIHYKYHGWA